MDDQTPQPNGQSLIKTIIFYLDTLEVFMLQTQYEFDFNISKGVYWKDAASPQGYGPFKSVFQCMEHYAWIAKGNKAVLKSVEPMPTTPIRVDFQKKRRIEIVDR